MLDKIIEIISAYAGIPKDKLGLKSDLIKDAGLSSFDVMELICKFEDAFDIVIPDRDVRALQTVEDILDYISKDK